MKEDKLIHLIQNGREEKAFMQLYKLYPGIKKYILSNSGSKSEAEDIFQEALIVLYNKVIDMPSDTKINLKGFLVNTCKFLWSNELRKKKVRQGSSEEGLGSLEYEDEIAQQLEREEKFKTIEEVLQKLGEKCKEILELFYFRNFSMEKIARKFGYKAVQSAKAKKYKCMEHARKLALSNDKNQ